ncbi:hypothetical protein PSACC_00025 [Paramicrosporidium saccamoebae]|uniref:DUF8032 domain-containing protein n=1 Tax=Paramicrosporidium saccamoebae TaxID=1246581 RepID=A0A2H9TR18_9FUNG|nr:hypothetical protein PSACC_00025 [Paramicrosporidium saccamoebae]
MDDLTLRLDDNEELNALTLTTLLNNGAEVLLNLSPAQLIQLEKKVQKLKRQKSPPATGIAAVAPSTKSGGTKKRRLSDGSNEHIERPRPTGGQYMNLPASTPQVEYRDTIEWLIFTYSTKGHIQEYHIRADIDTIGHDEIPDDFKAENCVYPRALVPREAYIGNRWEYETAVNEIAWKLCWRNPGVLGNKRGLIQRAVDSYRNRTPENRSRRVMRQEKLHQSSPFNKRASVMDGAAAMGLAPTPLIRVPGPKTLTLQYADREGELTKIKIRVDIEGVDLTQVDEDFRANNAIFPQAMMGGAAGYSNEHWEYENSCNELGWKLAWLNSAKLAGKRGLLHKAVEAYQSRIEAAERARQAVLHHHQQVLGQAGVYDPSMLYDSSHGLHPQSYHHHHGEEGILEKNEEFSQMVAQALQQALAQGVPADSSHYPSHDPSSSYHHLPYPHAIVDDHQFHHHHHIHHQDAQQHSGEIERDEDEQPHTVSTADLLRSL